MSVTASARRKLRWPSMSKLDIIFNVLGIAVGFIAALVLVTGLVFMVAL